MNRQYSRAYQVHLNTLPLSPSPSPNTRPAEQHTSNLYFHTPASASYSPAYHPAVPPDTRTPALTVVASPAIRGSPAGYYQESPFAGPGYEDSSPAQYPTQAPSPRSMPLFPQASPPQSQFYGSPEPSTSRGQVHLTDRDKQEAQQSSFRLESSEGSKIPCICGRTYLSRKTYNKHWAGCKENKDRTLSGCDICGATFARKDVLKKHKETHNR